MKFQEKLVKFQKKYPSKKTVVGKRKSRVRESEEKDVKSKKEENRRRGEKEQMEREGEIIGMKITIIIIIIFDLK